MSGLHEINPFKFHWSTITSHPLISRLPPKHVGDLNYNRVERQMVNFTSNGNYPVAPVLWQHTAVDDTITINQRPNSLNRNCEYCHKLSMCLLTLKVFRRHTDHHFFVCVLMPERSSMKTESAWKYVSARLQGASTIAGTLVNYVESEKRPFVMCRSWIYDTEISLCKQ